MAWPAKDYVVRCLSLRANYHSDKAWFAFDREQYKRHAPVCTLNSSLWVD